MRCRVQGFTLLELMITIAIVGILATIAIPSYQQYSRKAYYSEIVQATAPYKIAVAECFHELGALSGCNAGSNGISEPVTNVSGAIAALTVSNGVITVTPAELHGIKSSDTYILTPLISNDSMQWKSSGGGVLAGYAK